MEKEITLKSDELMTYIRNSVKIHDTLEISYNMVFVPGELLDIELDDEESLKILIKINGELVNDTVQIDLFEIKDDLVEVVHINGYGESTVIAVYE